MTFTALIYIDAVNVIINNSPRIVNFLLKQTGVYLQVISKSII